MSINIPRYFVCRLVPLAGLQLLVQLLKHNLVEYVLLVTETLPTSRHCFPVVSTYHSIL